MERFVVEGISWDTTQDKVPEDGKIEGKEKFKLDDLSRDKQILSVIRQIIDVDESAIDYLHINEAFVEEIMVAQMEATANNIEGVVRELSQLTDNASPEAINRFSARLQGDSEEIAKLVALVGRIAPVNRLYHFQEEISRKQQEIAFKQQQLLEAQSARQKAEEEKAELEKRLALEKEKNTYLLTSSRSMSEDAKGMVHNIKIIANSLHAMISLQYKKLAACGLRDYFDTIVLSEDAGANKPSKAFFDYAFAKTGATPETTLMIGDNMATDIQGAMASGIDTLLFNRWQYDIKTGDPEAPTYLVSKLLDIKQIL